MHELNGLSLRYTDEKLEILDQQLLPHKEQWITCSTPDQMAELIHQLKVRGAPLIGVAAVLALAQFARRGATEEQFREAAQKLRAARPTAVNLMAAIDRILQFEKGYNPEEVVAKARAIFAEDIELCQRIAQNGAQLIDDGDAVVTHCNTGGLATAGVGTALGVIRAAHEQGKRLHVFVDETRPLFQGGRLTTYELKKLGIPHTLICDSMVATLMAQGRIQKAFVGADRIAVNGDFANKVGTYSLALVSFYHRVPFYVAAPLTTVDVRCPNGRAIPIEERSASEIIGTWAPTDSQVYNPAFDVTPAEFVSGWILDTGVYKLQDIQSGILKGV